jgi:hypothetical protein
MRDRGHGGGFHHRGTEDAKLREAGEIGASDFGEPARGSFGPTQPFPRLGPLEDFKHSSTAWHSIEMLNVKDGPGNFHHQSTVLVLVLG